MGKYNSTEQRINIPLSEYQDLKLNNRILWRAVDEGLIMLNEVNGIEKLLYKEDMNDE